MNDISGLHAHVRQPPLLDVALYANTLWQRRNVVLGCMTLCIVLAFLYLGIAQPVYTATSVLIVDPRESQTTAADDVLPGFGSDSAAIASQVAVIGSRELLESVFQGQGLAVDSEFAGGGLLSSILSALSGGAAPVSEQEAFERFQDRVSVEREGLTYVIHVSFKSADPQKAAVIANAIASAYIDGQMKEKSSANAAVTDLLIERVTVLQAELKRAEEAVEDYKVRHGMHDSSAGGSLLKTRIDQLQSQLVGAQEQKRAAETRYEQALAAGSSPAGLQRLTQILSSPAAETLRQDYNAGEAALASARSRLGPRHPTLLAQAAQLQRLETLIVQEAERITRDLEAEYNQATSNVTKIEDALNSLLNQSSATDRRAVELRQLERNAEALRSVLDEFQKRSQETGELKQVQLANARLISAAVPPNRASWPKPMLVVGLASFIGIAGGMMLAIGLSSTTAQGRAAASRQIAAEPMRRDAEKRTKSRYADLL